jgi:hypothetical protein
MPLLRRLDAEQAHGLAVQAAALCVLPGGMGEAVEAALVAAHPALQVHVWPAGQVCRTRRFLGCTSFSSSDVTTVVLLNIDVAAAAAAAFVITAVVACVVAAKVVADVIIDMNDKMNHAPRNHSDIVPAFLTPP